MDEFEFVSIVEGGLSPAVTRDDIAIQFDGNTVGLHSQEFDQAAEGELLVESSLFAVDLEFQFAGSDGSITPLG